MLDAGSHVLGGKLDRACARRSRDRRSARTARRLAFLRASRAFGEAPAPNHLLVMADGTADSVDVELAGKGGSLDVLALEATVQPKAGPRIAEADCAPGARGEVYRCHRAGDCRPPEQRRRRVLRGPRHGRAHTRGDPCFSRSGTAKVIGPDVDLTPLSAFVSSTSGWIAGRGSLEVDSTRAVRARKGSAHVRLAKSASRFVARGRRRTRCIGRRCTCRRVARDRK